MILVIIKLFKNRGLTHPDEYLLRKTQLGSSTNPQLNFSKTDNNHVTIFPLPD